MTHECSGAHLLLTIAWLVQLSIKYDWILTVSALKMMAPKFAAYDHTIHQQLVPEHRADLKMS